MSTPTIKKVEMEVFSEVTNVPVIRHPGRNFPGSLIQGNSLSIIYQLATSIRGRAKKTGDIFQDGKAVSGMEATTLLSLAVMSSTIDDESIYQRSLPTHVD
jgi:hypothetical protein